MSNETSHGLSAKGSADFEAMSKEQGRCVERLGWDATAEKVAAAIANNKRKRKVVEVLRQEAKSRGLDLTV